MVRILTIILAGLGVFIIFGSVGSVDVGSISELQCFLQSLLGVAFLIPYGLRKLYNKYHNTI